MLIVESGRVRVTEGGVNGTRSETAPGNGSGQPCRTFRVITGIFAHGGIDDGTLHPELERHKSNY